MGNDEEERFESAWKVKWDENQHLSARPGDHLLLPFECDLCIFVKLMNRHPLVNNSKDKRLVACIRRINLDAFWSRASNTISNNLRSVKRILTETHGVGLSNVFVSKGPMPEDDHCGYQIAIAMILYSTRPGRHSKEYTQFDTIRHLRSAHSSFELSGALNSINHLSLSSAGGFQRDILQLSTATVWFKRFFEGCRSRMGQISKPNLALPTDLIVRILKRIEEEVSITVSKEEKFDGIIFGTYVMISYVLSLRGSEGLMLNLSALTRESDSKRSYCIIPLKGKFKGESAERDHILPCCLRTSSNIDVAKWLKMVKLVHKMAGRSGGPAITNWNGSILTSSDLDDNLTRHLEELFLDGASFPLEIKSTDDISERFSVFRSFRRASNTRAINMKVNSNDIDVVNRWKSIEGAQGKKPSRPMRQHYAEVGALIQPFLRYTTAM